jgi:sec-independent protein translocase protein TatA
MIGFKELLIIAVIIALLFGTSKLRNIGSDIGTAIKNFKKSASEGEDSTKTDSTETDKNKTDKKS